MQSFSAGAFAYGFQSFLLETPPKVLSGELQRLKSNIRCGIQIENQPSGISIVSTVAPQA